MLTKRIDAEVQDNDSDENDNECGYVSDVLHTSRTNGNRYNASVKLIRDTLASYFVGSGQVSWQWKRGNV